MKPRSLLPGTRYLSCSGRPIRTANGFSLSEALLALLVVSLSACLLLSVFSALSIAKSVRLPQAIEEVLHGR